MYQRRENRPTSQRIRSAGQTLEIFLALRERHVIMSTEEEQITSTLRSRAELSMREKEERSVGGERRTYIPWEGRPDHALSCFCYNHKRK